MAPVARRLCGHRGVLEPLQTADSLGGQVEELKTVLQDCADFPVFLIGFSWGAWLSFITAARYPELVKKLILVGSGPFEEEYAANITSTRLSRLTEEERNRLRQLTEAMNDSAVENKNRLFAEFGKLFTGADAFDRLTLDADVIECKYNVYENVWADAEELRSSGRLLALASHIQCPVTAIHGDYDPHPAEGVREPLSKALKDFRFILLENCGHTPWIESRAKDKFYETLDEEVH